MLMPLYLPAARLPAAAFRHSASLQPPWIQATPLQSYPAHEEPVELPHDPPVASAAAAGEVAAAASVATGAVCCLLPAACCCLLLLQRLATPSLQGVLLSPSQFVLC